MSEQEQCFERYASQNEGQSGCSTAWDSLFCWPPTSPNSTVSFPCSRIFPFLKETHEVGTIVAVAFRICDPNGQWSRNGWTNYTQCEQLEIELSQEAITPMTISIVVFTMSMISLISLCAAFAIFTTFESLQCTRIRVHRNLISSLILHAVLMIVVSSAGLHENAGQLLKDTDWLCKGVLSLKTYSAMASVHWMFVEGLLLHNSITVSVFERQPNFKIYYGIGWGIPSVCVCTWILLMDLLRNKPCWVGYGHSPLIWLVTGPMIVALLVNAVFLVNIVRILVTKMRTTVAVETKQVIKAARATALLFPLLGITHLLFCVNPGGNWEPFYMLVNAVLQSSQGLFVAILYCFINSEVQSVLKMAYTRRSSVWRDDRRQRSSRMFGTSFSTNLPPTACQKQEDEEEETAFNLPTKGTA